VAKRRANAMKEVKKLASKGQPISPVQLDGRKIASTFWGKAWCENLEAYSDFASRLPRGRTYVRNGSVVDLQINPGSITALVSGSELYRVKISIKPLPSATWEGVRRNCAGQIASVIELLNGRISDHVMQIVTNQSTGLFPSPKEIEMECSCPDWAGMCKHVAATLYGVGARLDQKPDLLFALRKVDHLDLVAQAAEIQSLPQGAAGAMTIDAENLSDVFGIELNDLPSTQNTDAPAPKSRPKRPSNSGASLKAHSAAKPSKSVKSAKVQLPSETKRRPRKQNHPNKAAQSKEKSAT
jgi:uncharacterized Zn finger protein